MRKVVVLTVSFIGGLCAALGAHAEEQSAFYLGGSVGKATNEVGEFKGSDFAFKLSGGYAFNRYFAIDVAYGLGIDVAISSDLMFRAEYEAVDVSAGDFQILSAGVVYTF